LHNSKTFKTRLSVSQIKKNPLASCIADTRCSLKSFQQGISPPVFYGDLMYKLKKIKGNESVRSLEIAEL
jgi:hypothetical protein